MKVHHLQYMFEAELSFEGDGVDDFDSYSLHLAFWDDDEKYSHVTHDIERSDVQNLIEGAEKLIKALKHGLPGEGYP